MKNKASAFVKQIINALAAMTKAKTAALKSKTRAFKARLVIFSLLRDRKFLMSSISQKLNALVGQQDEMKIKLKRGEDDDCEETGNERSEAMVVYNQSAMSSPQIYTHNHHEYEIEDGDGDGDEEEGEKYPDLTHSLFDSENFEDPAGSVIDIVKHSKEDKGEEFRLEDEIDRVADLFIKRFHRQMWMQKQLSFKNYQEMLERSA